VVRAAQVILAACKALTYLNLRDSSVSGDVAPLAALTKLKGLYCYHTLVNGSTAPVLAATAMTSCTRHPGFNFDNYCCT
jgi:hypothetical protein